MASAMTDPSDKLRRAVTLPAAGLLLAIVGCLLANVASRSLGLPLIGANLAAGWLFVALAFTGLCAIVVDRFATRSTVARGQLARRLRDAVAALVSGFALAVTLSGLAEAGARVGGVEAVLGIAAAYRFHAGAILCALALSLAGLSGRWRAIPLALGAALALAPRPELPLQVAALAFAGSLLARVPVPLALLAAAALVPAYSDAALAQSVVRGLSVYVLLAVPLFVFAAALMVEGGIGARIVAAARWLGGARATALGEANVLASSLFGGVSGSSIADAAMNAKLLAPPMIAARYPPARVVALTAAAAVLPNLLPPSIALLLAAAATDQSVAALWLGGVGAGATLALALWIAVRLTPPSGPPPARPSLDAIGGRGDIIGIATPLALALAVVGALRGGLVTPVEAGLVAILVGAIPCLTGGGWQALVRALSQAALQSGRIAILIGAASPLAFLFATRGPDLADWLPAASLPLAIAAAVGVCLLVGTVLDAGAAILIVLPILLPVLVGLGADPIHMTVGLTAALLIGGLTPPVGILLLVVEDVTGAKASLAAVLPYLLALTLGVAVVLAVPVLTLGMARL